MLTTCCRLCCLSFLMLASGCAVCATCDDDTYPADGGRWQRLDPSYGRVGSLFTPEVWTKTDGYDREAWAGEEISPAEPTPSTDIPPEATDKAPFSAEPDEAPAPVPEASVLQRRWTTNR